MGKTSLSISVAIEAARMGKKVAAITVDPSRRLAHLMGLKEQSDIAQSVTDNALNGMLDIFYVDVESTFQSFVKDHISDNFFSNIQSNKIYQQISQNLRETHNFAALYKTVKVLNLSQYDLVILDTPPCHQVIEFFESPSRLKKMFGSKGVREKDGWVTWVQKKGMFAVERVLAQVAGREFVEEINSFFQAVGHLREEVNRVSDEFIRLLQSNQSQLLLVFSGASDKIEEAKFLQREIVKNNFKVDSFVLNRSYILGLDLSKELPIGTDSYEEELYNYFVNQRSESLYTLKKLNQEFGSRIKNYIMLPELSLNLKTRDDVMEFSSQIKMNWNHVQGDDL